MLSNLRIKNSKTDQKGQKFKLKKNYKQFFVNGLLSYNHNQSSFFLKKLDQNAID